LDIGILLGAHPILHFSRINVNALGVEVSYAWNTVPEECGKRVEVNDMGYEVLQDISHCR
jgi:hypothetical protein